MLGLAVPLAAVALFQAPDTGCAGIDVGARLTDGGAVRVCQAEWGTTAYFAGHLAHPLAAATLRFEAGAPEVRVSNQVVVGASAYTVTYTLTNTSGAPVVAYPRVELNGAEAATAAGGFARLRAPIPEQEVTLAGGGTVSYSATVDLGQPRELILDAPAGQVSTDPVFRVGVRVTDERARAGALVRFTFGAATQAVALAPDGTALLALPMTPGRTPLKVWFDADDDGVADPGEPSREGDFDGPPPSQVFPVDSGWTPPPGYQPPGNSTVTVPFRRTYKVKGCAGKTVKLTLKDGRNVLATRSAKLDKRCRVKTSFKVRLALLDAAGPMTVELRLRGRVKRYALRF